MKYMERAEEEEEEANKVEFGAHQLRAFWAVTTETASSEQHTTAGNTVIQSVCVSRTRLR